MHLKQFIIVIINIKTTVLLADMLLSMPKNNTNMDSKIRVARRGLAKHFAWGASVPLLTPYSSTQVVRGKVSY